ncbi:MAG: acyltransferase domain-containing protein, partial [Euryarchaeota archaeon]|nr:acyltransferase domain-containing protein [Euryarchaeota archaeon]
DAACASTMAAVLDACRMLQSRQVNLMLAGASDRTMDPATYAKFSAIGALSPSHSTPFDARADGFVMGEGAGVLVLKRLDDAVEDGNDIHAVIRGIGASSDGRGKGITAPSQRGQMQALARAYSQAGFSPATVELVEAHGTSTKVGDAMELATLNKLWHEVEGGQNIAVGSVKSQIGHLKAAAGIAGMLKTINAVSKGVIPPSAGFETPNTSVDWNASPFYVPTYAREWAQPSDTPRRAAVSAFGFGGTNWHVILEQFDRNHHFPLAVEWRQRWTTYLTGSPAPTSAPTPPVPIPAPSTEEEVISKPMPNAESILDKSAKASLSWEELKAIEGGVLLLESEDLESLQSELQQATDALLSGGANFDDDPAGRRLSKELAAASEGFTCKGARMAIVATSWAQFEKRSALALKTMIGRDKWEFLKSQGVMITDGAPVPEAAKVAHLYPGQGSQYVGMTHDLSLRYSSVAEVWNRADKTMVDILDGETLSSFVLRSDLSVEEKKEAEEKLKQTEYTQPAMLTTDLAIDSVLSDHGRLPDMVAGHSLGEYAALMVSGILGMDGALRAAAARGTEMGSVVIEDTGLMASITADYNIIKDVLSTIDGYVIAANKNSPRMTVIAGDSPSVKEAIRRFEGLDITAVILPTSHAFHSTIVEPAAEPLRKFLDGLEINLPEIPITSNVDGTFYPMNRDENRTPKEQILDKLAPQMSSPVEWTKQIETMYKAGARVFVEVGPKRALTMFANQILEDKPNLSVMTNHPKFGGVASIMNALATMAIAGRPYRWPRSDSQVLTEGFRAGPLEVWESAVVEPKATDDEKPDTESQVVSEEIIEAAVVEEVAVEKATDTADWLATILSAASGYPAKFCYGQVNLKTGLGMNDEVIESVLKSITKQVEVEPSKDPTSFKTAIEIIEWIQGVPDSFSVPQKSTESSVVESQSRVAEKTVQVAPKDHRKSNPYVVTGVSLGLPGDRKVFDEDNFEKLVRGETCIQEVSDDYKQKILDKKIVRLIKGRDGQARMETAQNFEDIPQLAGLAGGFDITEEFGISEKVAKSWDITTQLATAAGLLALRDAGIPLTPVEKIGKGGLRLITNWKVPSVYRDNTGIIFASCFPGSANTARHSMNNGDDGEGNFDRSYLFQTLNMGHSQFAQFTGIRGPNSTINLACASTAAAFTVAEDWLETGRCERVVVISSDDVTGPDLWEWIGAGFAASGAASTSSLVEEAALPFDQRRNGLILGMGAAAFIIEKKEGAAKRGVQPYAELLGAHIGNSAFHGTRLDVENVASQVDGFVSRMEKRWGIERKTIAPNTVFFSHETYTPARGGSAQAEVKALRDTFAEATDSLLISNTKGFTGHPMGVGIEDASMIHALATGRIPPIANHKVFDSELGNLNLSKGGYHENINYGLRFAAGFGSQIAITLWKSSVVDGERIDVSKLLQWNRKLAGTEDLTLKVLKNKLVAYVDGENNLHGGM